MTRLTLKCLLVFVLLASVGFAEKTPDIAGFRKRAEMGDVLAQYQLGWRYANGVDVPENDAEAVKWYRKAAEQWHAPAQCNLGMMYFKGEGVPKDLVQSHVWLNIAAAKGNKDASTNLYMVEPSMSPEQMAEAMVLARELFEKSAADTSIIDELRKKAGSGDAFAQEKLGMMYTRGEGAPKDFVEAVKWYRMAAEQGYAKAQERLGMMYKLGYGVSKNNAEAAKWYRKAAEQGYGYAQYFLGEMYAEGDGMLKDLVLAHVWWNISGASVTSLDVIRGAFDAKPKRNDIEKKMTPEQTAEAMKLARVLYEKIAAEIPITAELRNKAVSGDALAQYKLGLNYAIGDGVPKDTVSAVKWYLKAAEKGYAEAQYGLGLMYSGVVGVPEDLVQAHAWFNIAGATGHKDSIAKVSLTEWRMTPEQKAEAQKLAKEIWGKLPKK